MGMDLPRRQFLTYLGMGSLALLASSRRVIAAPFPLTRPRPPAPGFDPIAAVTENLREMDAFRVPTGFRADVVAKWGDALGSTGPRGPEAFGFNNDFTAFLPDDFLTGGSSTGRGLLWANHEVPDPKFVSGWRGGPKTRKMIEEEMLSVGGSVVGVERTATGWRMIPGDSRNRRVTGLYPEFTMTGPAKDKIPVVVGTVGNCSGGVTPWGTILTCEEQFDSLYDGYGWGDSGTEPYPIEHHGWVMEVDPFGELEPQVHSCLGRFAHENCAFAVASDGRLVVYMGDDTRGQHLYKYISQDKLDRTASRAEQRKLLTSGTLYAANLVQGRWHALDVEEYPEMKGMANPAYADQADLLIRPMFAAKAMGATPLDRPEDCEVHPLDGSLYLALTNNTATNNFYGHILRLVEDRDDAASETFRWELFLTGGPQSGLACPDNLCFDRQGNLWIATDFSSGPYAAFGNNGLFCVPTAGPATGYAYQFASGPNDCEICGPYFTPDESTLFLAVQHPGYGSVLEEDIFTSRWPMGAPDVPRPAVVAITGF